MSAGPDLFARLIGSCPECGTVVVVEHGAAFVTEWRCPRCPGYAVARVARVRGTVTDRPCDSRCTRGKGRTCECSCGGRRHGSDWLGSEPPGRSLVAEAKDRPGGASR